MRGAPAVDVARGGQKLVEVVAAPALQPAGHHLRIVAEPEAVAVHGHLIPARAAHDLQGMRNAGQHKPAQHHAAAAQEDASGAVAPILGKAGRQRVPQ